ncbi:hypothetical protein FB567DRAFT_624349 [Paraphoma chrysanthemicola]|uniref:Uncharacterized protein n=1 Tax=Paraphoma chrysanthemicola TaxID=798071 RepID=A0A8K0W3T2_9PLEO|nr:hypothetical protein FB567DRAFT_624349 [Paraphoma chrysanthemicola]
MLWRPIELLETRVCRVCHGGSAHVRRVCLQRRLYGIQHPYVKSSKSYTCFEHKSHFRSMLLLSPLRSSHPPTDRDQSPNFTSMASKLTPMMHVMYIMFIFIAAVASFPLSANSFHFALTRSAPRHVARQVGDGVNGNQTNNNGSTGGTGLGDGNGVGFAGTGNDIDTGDDFDIGDGNTTMGDGNSIEIGDRITNINIPLNMSDILAKGIEQGRAKNGSGGLDMNIDITMRVRIADRDGESVSVLQGGSGLGRAAPRDVIG